MFDREFRCVLKIGFKLQHKLFLKTMFDRELVLKKVIGKITRKYKDNIILMDIFIYVMDIFIYVLDKMTNSERKKQKDKYNWILSIYLCIR